MGKGSMGMEIVHLIVPFVATGLLFRHKQPGIGSKQGLKLLQFEEQYCKIYVNYCCISSVHKVFTAPLQSVY